MGTRLCGGGPRLVDLLPIYFEMVKYIFSLLVGVLATIVPADIMAVNVESVAGRLSSMVSNPDGVTELTLSGSVNAADLDFIDSKMTNLKVLDMSNVTIEAYDGTRLRGLSMHPAGMIPATMFSSSKIKSLKLPAKGQLTLGDAAFAGSAIESVTLGSNVVSMGHGVFSSCQSLTDATISTDALGQGAFSNCKSLTKVTFTVATSLPAYAFSDCTALTQVNGSDKFTEIDTRAFSGCTALQSMTFGKGLVSIGDRAFAGAGLVRIDLSPCSSLTTVGDWAFAQMPALESLDLGDPQTVGTGFVFECPKLKNLVFSDRATEIPDYAYTKNTSMDTTYMFNPDVTHIGRQSLSGLSQVTTLTLPPALESLGDQAMENMTSLGTLTLSATAVPSTGSDVWAGINQKAVALLVPTELTDAYRGADQWKEFTIFGISGIDDAVSDSDGESALLRAAFIGDLLVVEYMNMDISTIGIYDIDGRMLDSKAATPDGFVAFDATRLGSATVFILTATDSQGITAAIKITR